MPGINSCVELQKIGNDPAYPLNGSYILTNNIDCRATNPGDPANDGSICDKDGSIYGTGGTGFKPIGLFSGIFDGKGYQIQNLYMSYKAAIYYDTFAGLFGEANGAEIKEISLTNISITASRFTINQYCYAGGLGGLVGYNNNTNISNSYATASVMADGGGSSSGTGYAGGLVGYNNNTNISNSYATGPVSADSSGATANSYAGGLVGYTDNTIILNSYATGPVMSNGTSRTYAGGLIGQTYRNISVSDSYATGPVTATSDEISAGGLIGYSNVGNLIYNIIISDSYATGPVTATSDGTIFTCDISAGGLAGKTLGNTAISNSYAAGLILTTGIGSDISAGGLVGNIYSAASISNSYWDREASGLSVGCGNTSCSGATGKTTSAMITESTYSGWTFQPPVTDIWKLSVITPADRYYPCLSWQANATCVKAPLLIFTCEDLQKIGNDAAYPLNGNYILTNNIDCAKTDPSNSGNPSSIWDDAGSTYGTGGTGFEPIGWDSPFTGIFDGKGYQIQNLYINRPTNSFVGLFSYANSATIKNVGVIVDNILGGAYTGALLGICNAWCDIDSVYSISTSTGSGAVDNYWGGFVGGLAGEIRDTNISNSYSTVPVTGTYVVGGLVGYNNNSSIISNSYFSGVVTGNNNSIGGLAGRNNGTIINSYAISNVSGVQYYEAGGLVGLFEGGTISKSYVVGAVSGATYKGGLVGTYYAGGVFSDSYWNTEVSGLSNICGSGSGKMIILVFAGRAFRPSRVKIRTAMARKTEWIIATRIRRKPLLECAVARIRFPLIAVVIHVI
ncbi:hypothetical protein HY797_01695 [Candidatus Falkowbacteria bacterium]|nr:hypothetical protein [Candidatus Falkowbacteria bacterium]